MRALTNTNIIVDDFDYCKNYPKKTFIHFLSHYHGDHYKGMTPGWDYGPIYCSEITKMLILANFPNIADIRTAPLNTKFEILLDSKDQKKVEITFFDANHIPGSVMMLFQGYMGTILHTGDMRFKDSMLYENTILYPIEKRNKSHHKCSIHIDELIFDNTYINPVHRFPTREKAIKMVIDIIEKNRGKYVILAMGILGKERVALEVARHFQTTLVIPDRKYRLMQAMNMPTNQMKTERGGNWIEVIHKIHREARLEEEARKGNENFIMICVDFTGFQVAQLTAKDGINYLVPYSQHSNYPELEKFVKSICPSILRKLVLQYIDRPQFKNRPISNLAVYSSYVKNLIRGGKSVFAHFLKSYTDLPSLSSEYKIWMRKEAQKELMAEFKIPMELDTNLRRVAKRRTLEKKLEALTKKGVDVEALADKVFHSEKRKRRSFADITLHKLAINNSQRLDTLFLKMGGKKKIKKTVEEPVKKVAAKTTNKGMKEDYSSINTTTLAKIKPLSLFEFQKKVKYDPSKDCDLMHLLNNFVSKGSEVVEKQDLCSVTQKGDNMNVVIEEKIDIYV